jgi:hypothetical protein
MPSFASIFVTLMQQPLSLVMRPFLILSTATLFLSVSSCDKLSPGAGDTQFATEPTQAVVAAGTADEASGMADSRSMPGTVWLEEDSGNPTELVLLGYDGKAKGRIAIPNSQNTDWEDMAMGPGPTAGVNYIYLGDIGDNNAIRPGCQIYRFAEPKNLTDKIGTVERINYVYPDGPRDAEALFVDPQTSDVWIISKRETKVRLYKLAYPQNINVVTTLQAFGEIPISVVTGAAISPDGTEILVRTYTGVYYWKRNAGQTVADALQSTAGRQLAYRLEPQGEAICFDKDAKGFFTSSERATAANTALFYYARK